MSLPSIASTQLGVISKVVEDTFNPIVCAADRDIDEHWSQDGPLGDTTYHWP